MQADAQSTRSIDYIDAQLRLDAEATRLFLVDFLRREVGNAGFSRGVIGLSGGIDSALSCSLAAEALGPDNVLALMLPYRTSDPASQMDAQTVISQLGVASATVDITPLVEPYFERTPDMSPRRRGNVMARARMIVLYDHSAWWNGLVIGTSNETEWWLGYGTVCGDMASAINPLGDLYKTQVRQLARAVGLPTSVLTKPPSADLWAGQTDEGEIGFRYADLDRALYLLIDEGLSVQQAVEYGLSEELLRGVTRMIAGSAFKRRLPLVARLPGESTRARP